MFKRLLAWLVPTRRKPQPDHREIIKAFREGKPLRNLKEKGGL